SHKDAFVRIDHALTLDFLTTMASCLHQENFVSDRDLTSLRAELSNVSGNLLSGETLLGELQKRNSEFLYLVTARYGTANFIRNLFRKQALGLLDSWIRQLGEFGIELL